MLYQIKKKAILISLHLSIYMHIPKTPGYWCHLKSKFWCLALRFISKITIWLQNLVLMPVSNSKYSNLKLSYFLNLKFRFWHKHEPLIFYHQETFTWKSWLSERSLKIETWVDSSSQGFTVLHLKLFDYMII